MPTNIYQQGRGIPLRFSGKGVGLGSVFAVGMSLALLLFNESTKEVSPVLMSFRRKEVSMEAMVSLSSPVMGIRRELRAIAYRRLSLIVLIGWRQTETK
jgi:hypothetical protein